MSATQRIVRVRRQYNQWVGNQTFEDYALRFTARSARRWSHGQVANTAIGSISFLALEAIGGLITLNSGFTNAVAAILVVSVLIFISSIAVGYYAARYGLDIDLLTRGAGFGYIGSTISSMIYAIFTFIFFAIEAAIMAVALEVGLGIPLTIGYAISALVIIPLVAYGITLISRIQLWTQPIWTVLQLLPFLAIAYYAPEKFHEWAAFIASMEAGPDFTSRSSARPRPSSSLSWGRSESRSISCDLCPSRSGMRSTGNGGRPSSSVGRAGLSSARPKCSRAHYWRSSPCSTA